MIVRNLSQSSDELARARKMLRVVDVCLSRTAQDETDSGMAFITKDVLHALDAAARRLDAAREELHRIQKAAAILEAEDAEPSTLVTRAVDRLKQLERRVEDAITLIGSGRPEDAGQMLARTITETPFRANGEESRDE